MGATTVEEAMGGCYDGACREPSCTKEVVIVILWLDSLSGRNSKASGSMVALIIT